VAAFICLHSGPRKIRPVLSYSNGTGQSSSAKTCQQTGPASHKAIPYTPNQLRDWPCIRPHTPPSDHTLHRRPHVITAHKPGPSPSGTLQLQQALESAHLGPSGQSQALNGLHCMQCWGRQGPPLLALWVNVPLHNLHHLAEGFSSVCQAPASRPTSCAGSTAALTKWLRLLQQLHSHTSCASMQLQRCLLTPTNNAALSTYTGKQGRLLRPCWL
jgi:hypothetical protein